MGRRKGKRYTGGLLRTLQRLTSILEFVRRAPCTRTEGYKQTARAGKRARWWSSQWQSRQRSGIWSALSHRVLTFTGHLVAAAALVRAGQIGTNCVDRPLLVGSMDDRSATREGWRIINRLCRGADGLLGASLPHGRDRVRVPTALRAAFMSGRAVLVGRLGGSGTDCQDRCAGGILHPGWAGSNVGALWRI